MDSFVKQNWLSIKGLLEYCNVSYHIINAKDFGYLNKTIGQWSGVIGDLLYGRAQLSGKVMVNVVTKIHDTKFIRISAPAYARKISCSGLFGYGLSKSNSFCVKKTTTIIRIQYFRTTVLLDCVDFNSSCSVLIWNCPICYFKLGNKI